MLQDVIECYTVLHSVTEYNRVLQIITEYCRVLQIISSASTWTNFWACSSSFHPNSFVFQGLPGFLWKHPKQVAKERKEEEREEKKERERLEKEKKKKAKEALEAGTDISASKS